MALRSYLYSCCVALLACLVALGLALLLGLITPTAPFPIFLVAVAFGAWRGGLVAGLLSTTLSLLAINYFFENPVYSLALTEVSTIVDLAVFIGAALVIQVSHERLTEAQRRIVAVQAEADRAHWLDFLSEAGLALGQSLEPAMALYNASLLGVRELGDWCLVHIIEEDGRVSLRRLAHKEVQQDALLSLVVDGFGDGLEQALGIAGVIRDRRSLRVDVRGQVSVVSRERPGDAWALEDLGFRSSVCVPLESRGKLLGTMTFVAGEATGPYDPGHLGKAEQLATRVALALDNANLHREALQQARGEGAWRSHRMRESGRVNPIVEARPASA
jgi:hypothetical protein